MSRKRIEKNLESMIFSLEVVLQEALLEPAPVLHINADAVVVEYNRKSDGYKVWERISDLG